ncbi:hypothetical protein CCICO_01260 [Corynebacterium ciconiae DSM 44920]|uniref:hypothetical protein n=1 Tax=Corynebacterium ciconiae TaxID=227319 RepID=UPI00037A779B|nr:hypothetical protein [Corynebacterium ciconiae]WKD60306.1 hypothetical protein CCICO_01260 [Corynebacterium ciconiae DSM 44920]
MFSPITPSRPVRRLLATVTALAMLPTATAHAVEDSPQPIVPHSAGPKTCVPHLGDPTQGYGQFPLGLVPPDFGDEGYEQLPVADPAGLPEQVVLRDNTQGFNEKVEVALREGELAVRHVGDPVWRELPTPDCLKGAIVGISVNEDALVALDDAGWIYTLSNLLSSPQRWGWIRAWGGPVWLGKGHQSPTTEPGRWALSVIGTHTDRFYETPDGKQQPISLAKVTQVVGLSEDGSRIYTLDPWLARDYSYEVGTPLNSRFQVRSISAGGSVMFVSNDYGDMYTRLSDFDINGSDPAQFRYTWGEDERPAAGDALRHHLDQATAPIGLPAEDWAHQPKIPGEITDRISIHSTGAGSSQRQLRVEGRHAGRTGYWHKQLHASEWQFTPTDAELKGELLENSPEDRSQDTLAAPSPFSYTGQLSDTAQLNITEFAYASPKRTVELVLDDRSYPLVLHTVDGRLGSVLSMRTLPIEGEFGPRPAGLVQDVPRNYMAAFEVPEHTRAAAAQDPALAAFLQDYLGGEQFHQVYLKATPETLEIINSPVPNLAAPLISDTATLHAPEHASP